MNGPRTKPQSNNRTGVPGVSYKRTLRRSRGKEERFFVAKFTGPNGRRVVREFSIDRLGRELAWEKALRCRAEYERTARASSISKLPSAK